MKTEKQNPQASNANKGIDAAIETVNLAADNEGISREVVKVVREPHAIIIELRNKFKLGVYDDGWIDIKTEKCELGYHETYFLCTLLQNLDSFVKDLFIN